MNYERHPRDLDQCVGGGVKYSILGHYNRQLEEGALGLRV